ncbi:MAG: nucleotidyltransferase domain-containing protein [Armatimonadetes bacterium]|nr:nucleotidyltransferase domain-containing protein [Armatimonadota bacterium]
MRKLSRVRKLSERDRQLLIDVKDVVMRFVPDAEVVLYGSVARGTATPESDYDIVVITGSKLSSCEERELDGAVYRLQLEREVVLSLMVYSREEWQRPMLRCSPYRKSVAKDGIVI